MAKAPAFQFYVRDWLTDEALNKCEPATRGIWIEALCNMFLARRRGRLHGTISQLASACHASDEAMTSAIHDLRKHNAATIHERNGCVTLISRRMVADDKKRRDTLLRVQKYRAGQECNANVTPGVTQMKHRSASASASASAQKNPPTPQRGAGFRYRRRGETTGPERVVPPAEALAAWERLTDPQKAGVVAFYEKHIKRLPPDGGAGPVVVWWWDEQHPDEIVSPPATTAPEGKATDPQPGADSERTG